MNKKKKPKLLKEPDNKCYSCLGDKRVRDQYITRFFGSSNWTYKECPECEGTGRINRCCVECGELLEIRDRTTYSCFNLNCSRFGLASFVYENPKLLE